MKYYFVLLMFIFASCAKQKKLIQRQKDHTVVTQKGVLLFLALNEYYFFPFKDSSLLSNTVCYENFLETGFQVLHVSPDIINSLKSKSDLLNKDDYPATNILCVEVKSYRTGYFEKDSSIYKIDTTYYKLKGNNLRMFLFDHTHRYITDIHPIVK